MARRQFRSDDTSQWDEKFFGGEDGAEVDSGTTTDAPIDAAVTGTSGTKTLSGTNAAFSSHLGKPVLIIQYRGTNANVNPNYELNVLTSYSAGTIGLKYDLTRDYTTGAQIIVADRLSSYSNTGTLYPKEWNGSTGGVLFRMVAGTWSNSGTIDLRSRGFRGGQGRHAGTPFSSDSGEGYSKDRSISNPSGDNAGGSSSASNSSGSSRPGSGGGNATTGGQGINGIDSGTYGDGGLTSGNTELTILLAGGGGSGGMTVDPASKPHGKGGDSAAIMLIIAETINNTGAIKLDGENGESVGDKSAAGGGSAASSGLFKGKNVNLGSLATASKGLGGTGIGGSRGGHGSDGRFAVDYSQGYTGTTAPMFNARKDEVFEDDDAAFLLNLL